MMTIQKNLAKIHVLANVFTLNLTPQTKIQIIMGDKKRKQRKLKMSLGPVIHVPSSFNNPLLHKH